MENSYKRHWIAPGVALCCLVLISSALSTTRAQDAATPPAKSLMAEGTGPYKVVIEGDPGLPTHTIYRPENVKAVKGKLPIISFANGGCANSSNGFRPFLTEIASHGFLVVAIGPAASVVNAPPPQPAPAGGGPARGTGGPGGPGGDGRGAGGGGGAGRGGRGPATKSSQLLDGIAWATAENARDGSMYKGKIATNKVAVMGQSCGGLQALDVSTDPRVTTAVILSGGIPDWSSPAGIAPGAPHVEKDVLTKQHGPIVYFFGGMGDIAYANCMDDFSRIMGVPAFAGSLTAALHAGTYAQPNGGEMGKVVVAWDEWQLQGMKDQKKMFVGDKCELCTNSDWKVQQKDLK
jgi:dienelactone hydrolase